jgi:DNA topoisomerase-1
VDLIVIESPNKVKNVEKYAAAAGLQATVLATRGHLIDLPPMKEGACVDVARFVGERLVPRDASAADRLARIKSAISKADRVIVASDPDREGEAIAAEVWSLVPRAKAWRARFEEITAAGVAAGLRAMTPELNAGQVDAATTRRLVDRLAGWHATSVLFSKLRQHKGISAGRLQSAALRLVVDRYREHKAFKPTTTFGVRVRLRTPKGEQMAARVVDGAGEALMFKTKSEAEAFAVVGVGTVMSVTANRSNQRPRPPFTATSWLQVAQKALGLSVKDAGSATQGLFEAGSTTYPRTDSVRVADEAVEWARAELERRFGSSYVPTRPWIHKDSDPDAQGAHEAVRPTVPHGAESVSGRSEGQWGEAYQLIEARFLASQAAARVVDQTAADITVGEIRLRARGEVEVFDGWKRVLRGDIAEEGGAEAKPTVDDGGALPALAEGDRLTVLGTEVVAATTRPPAMFSQASLVAELQRRGIGRPSTYGVVVPLIIARGWVVETVPSSVGGERKKNRELPVLAPTQVGEDLADFLKSSFPGLVDYEFTAQLERELDRIEAGKNTRTAVGKEWWARFEEELRRAAATVETVRKDLGPCPKCSAEGRQGRLRLFKGTSKTTSKPYEFGGCDADTREKKTCGYTAPVTDGQIAAKATCPDCSGTMRAVTRQDGSRALVCDAHGWFVADASWRRVEGPKCTRCGRWMVQRRSRESRKGFVWACFDDQLFIECDAAGTVTSRRGGRR